MTPARTALKLRKQRFSTTVHTEGSNALIIGKPGTGKSHVAKALAYQGTLQGYNVLSKKPSVSGDW